MSSSKGVGCTAKDIAEVLPPELLRFSDDSLPPQPCDPVRSSKEAIPRLFDEYDRCATSPTHPPAAHEAKDVFLQRAYELSQLRKAPPKEFCHDFLYWPPGFRFLAYG